MTLRARALLAICIAFSAGACAPAPPVPAASARVSELALRKGHGEAALLTPDGVLLHVQSWQPSLAPRARLVIVPGLRDHGDRYVELAQTLNKWNIAVVALDLRGHARSGGRRVTVDRLDRYADDVALLVRSLRDKDASTPLFLFGHSLGGAVAALYAERPGAEVDGLVLSAPALDLGVSELERCGAQLLAELSPHAPELEIDMVKWSRRPDVTLDNLRDPLVYQAGAPISTALALLAGADQALHEAPFVRVPLLVIHGGADEITRPSGSRRFVERARSADKQLRIAPGLYHDLWHEPERAELMRDLARWLSGRSPDPEGPNPAPEPGERELEPE